MNTVDAIKQLPYWEGTSSSAIEKFCEQAEEVHIDKGSVITEQFKSADDFYLLYDGSVDHYLTLLNETQLPIPVGRLDATWSAIGWSGFLEPHRYTTQTQSSKPCTLLRWHYEALKILARDDPEFYRGLLTLVTESSKALLEGTRNLLQPLSSPCENTKTETHQQSPRLRLKLEPASCINHLSYSTLFQRLKFHELKLIAEHCWLERCSRGMEIFTENESSPDVAILVRGKVNLSFKNKTTMEENTDSRHFVRSLSKPGQIISWSGLTLTQKQDVSAYAETDSVICFIPAEAITTLCKTRPDFSIKLRENLLHIVGSRLRSLRALLINQYTRNEHATVSSLLHNVGPQLSIDSPLHKVPYLLKNRNTQEDAFKYLDSSQKRGGPFENNIASLCGDILSETRKEADFYKGLKSIYQTVTSSNQKESPKSIRNKSAEAFSELFSNVRYRIKGQQLLPKTSGHIFILNHLVSHPSHQLPNGFEFSLDTHFISSLILQPKYGDSGLRVVRKNRHDEYGHESYYKRLGHIYVHTSESKTVADKNEPTNLNERFFEDATYHLQQKNNIIICPEGTSYLSEESPGPFRSGAFRLAAMQEADTLIVPIAVAGFDKPMNGTVFSAVINPPFRIRNLVDPKDPDSMRIFLQSLRAEYKGYVKEAQQLARDA